MKRTPLKRGKPLRSGRGLHQRQPMKKTRMKQYNRKRKGSAFPRMRDQSYTTWAEQERPDTCGDRDDVAWLITTLRRVLPPAAPAMTKGPWQAALAEAGGWHVARGFRALAIAPPEKRSTGRKLK